MHNQTGMNVESLSFTEPHDVAVPYMQRLRDYYLALGYGNPYRWAQFAQVLTELIGTPTDIKNVPATVNLHSGKFVDLENRLRDQFEKETTILKQQHRYLDDLRRAAI